jgi:hypothetical protein
VWVVVVVVVGGGERGGGGERSYNQHDNDNDAHMNIPFI